MLRTRILLVILCFLFPSWALEAQGARFRLVVHDTNPTQALPQKEVAYLFLKKQKKWSHDEHLAVVPFDLPMNSEIRQDFSSRVYQKSAASIKIYWDRNLFSGRETPPAVLATDQEILLRLAGEPGGIAYVALETPLPNGVKGIDIVDSGGNVLFTGRSGSREASQDDSWERKVTLSRHGDIHLFLTGTCGFDGAGRLALVENRRPDTEVQIQIERAQWVDGSFLRNQNETLVLGPLEEKNLGCTHPAAHSETRFSLAQVNDGGTYSHREATYGTAAPVHPARDQVQLVEGSSCGQGRAGHVIVLMNNDLARTITVEVSVHQSVDEGSSRRYRKLYQLAPGTRKELGCSQDGAVSRDVSVEKASYR